MKYLLNFPYSEKEWKEVKSRWIRTKKQELQKTERWKGRGGR